MLVNKDWKPNLYKYEKVRRSGSCNMLIEARWSIKACDTSSREHRDILLNYNTYKRCIEAQYRSVTNFTGEYKKFDF